MNLIMSGIFITLLSSRGVTHLLVPTQCMLLMAGQSQFLPAWLCYFSTLNSKQQLGKQLSVKTAKVLYN